MTNSLPQLEKAETVKTEPVRFSRGARAELIGWATLGITTAVEIALYKAGYVTPVKEHIAEVAGAVMFGAIGVTATAAAFTESTDGH